MKNNLSDIRMGAGFFSNNEKHEKMFKQMEDENSVVDKMGALDIFSEQMTCFLFEAVIRPVDKALVIHLKHLPPALRNRKFFDFATEFIRDRIGNFSTLEASFIGEVDEANKLNSLDLMFTKYYPAIRGDMDFIKKHTSRIGHQLDELLVRELGEYANKA